VSGANPTAPVLDARQISEFHADPLLRRNLLRSLDRMLAFYGLNRMPDRIDKAPDWPQRKSLWFTQPSHNHLRITRILKCLNTLGLEQEARALHQALVRLKDSEAGCGIPPSAFRYWSDAVTS
jgi:hypothetical protein